MQNKEAVGLHHSSAILEAIRHVAINVNNRAVNAVSGQIGNVVFAVEPVDAPDNGVECTLQH
jgi:hypothetical protein